MRNEISRRKLLFFSCLLLISARAWGRIFYPDLWAEDGNWYLSQGLRDGFGSLLIPTGGTFHIFQRLLALTALKLFPVALWPAFLTSACVLVFTASIFLLGDKRFAWLIPSDQARFAGALLLCLTPGLNEMVGNLANLNWFLFFWLLLIGLKDPSQPISRWEVITALLAIASIGTSVLLVPLFAWRLWNKKRNGNRWQEGTGEIAVLLLILVFNCLFVYFTLSGKTATAEFGYVERGKVLPFNELLFTGAKVCLNSFHISVLFRPWLGAGLSVRFLNTVEFAWLRFLALGALYFFLLRWLVRHRCEAYAQALFIATLSIGAWPLLRFVGRPGAAEEFFYFSNFFWQSRHAFPLGSFAVLFWLTVFRSFSLSRENLVRISKNTLLFALFFLGALHGLDRFFIRAYEWGRPEYPRERVWKTHAPALQAAIDSRSKETLRIPIYPGPESKNWWVEYQPRD